MCEIVLDRPRWWIELEAEETKRSEWVDTIAVSVTQEMLREAVGSLVARLYPVATCILKQYEAVKADGTEKKLSELLGTWPTDIDASHGPYQVIADHCLRGICREDVMAWPNGWGSWSCVCSGLQDLIEEATMRCLRVIQHVEAIPALKTCINEVHLDTDRTRQYVVVSLELLIAKYKLQLAPAIAPGPVSNLFIMDNPELLIASPLGDLLVGALPRQLKLEIDVDGVVTQISSFDGRIATSDCLSTALNSLVPLFNRSLACLVAYPPLAKGNGSRFTPSLPNAEELFPVETAAPFTLDGTSSQVAVRLICSEVIDNGDTDAVWHEATFYSDHDDNVLATGFVFLHVDNLVGPRVRYHGELLYADTHDLFRNRQIQQPPICRAPTTLCRPKGGCIAAVTALVGRVLVFPPYLQYQVVPSSRVDVSMPGTMVVLAVELLNPALRLASDPAENVDTLWSSETEEGALSDVNIVADGPKSYWSPEEARLVHYQRHFSAPELDTQQSSNEDMNPLYFEHPNVVPRHDHPQRVSLTRGLLQFWTSRSGGRKYGTKLRRRNSFSRLSCHVTSLHDLVVWLSSIWKLYPRMCASRLSVKVPQPKRVTAMDFT